MFSCFTDFSLTGRYYTSVIKEFNTQPLGAGIESQLLSFVDQAAGMSKMDHAGTQWSSLDVLTESGVTLV